MKQISKTSTGERGKTKAKKLKQGSTVADSLYSKLMAQCSLNRFIHVLHKPCSPGNIGVARFLFGLMMMIDIPDERGLSELDLKYGDPMKCHFPLFDWMSPLPLEYMGLLYFSMWLGAGGICLGFKFRLSCLMFTIPYWYIFLLNKTTWNNHSYLYGLLSILFTFSSAHHTFSLDSKLIPSMRNKPVPQWNYAILRFQLFLLYFYAGVKKFDLDWIEGHSMSRLSTHWVFDPFKAFLSEDVIDYWIVHVFGFVFDLTVGFFLLVDKTRPVAIVLSSVFHLMNSRIFHIGQFPYVCLCLTPLFCNYDWPERLRASIGSVFKKCDSSKEDAKKFVTTGAEESATVTSGQKLTLYLLTTYVGIQLFLPYSHFITKGYNNWTNGLYGYSWDMMVHNWDSVMTAIKVVDNDSGEELFVDPEAWVDNSRFLQYGDMLVQYARCLKRNLPNFTGKMSESKSDFANISVYADVWCSLNGRFQQRMFDPRQDLLTAEWNPFERIPWLMPLLSELTPWRAKMMEIEEEARRDSNETGVLFVADFPGLYLDNYVKPELTNVSLTVLKGRVIVESQKGESNESLSRGETMSIPTGEFHKVRTVSAEPSCFMYTFVNRTSANAADEDVAEGTLKGENDSFLDGLKLRMENLIDSILILRGCFDKFLYDRPIPVRIY